MQVGDRVGDYTIEEFIDEGAIAEIYRATHSSGNEFALKILHARDPEVIDRLMREGEALTRLHHRNLVAVSEVIKFKGKPVLVMDFIDGSTLEEWIEDEAPDLDVRLDVFGQLARGVEEVHRQGMVHRDLQPANVLVTEEGDGWKATVIDFGLVKGEAEGLTHPGVTMGTPGFMAPEQIISAATADARSDVFALAAILYYLVCDKEPFEGDTEVDIFNNTLWCKYASPLFAATMVPLPVVKAIDGALKRAPAERWESVGKMLEVMG